MKARILIVDDEQSVRDFFEILLSKEDYEVITVNDGRQALQMIVDQSFDLLIADCQLDGLKLLKEWKALKPNLPVILMTAFATTDSAVEALKNGACDYLTKPFKIEELKGIIQRALEQSSFQKNKILRSDSKQRFDFSPLIGESGLMKQMYDLIKKTAQTKTNVLVYGESGTGKELAARAIHFYSSRKDKPFVTVNCGAIPETLIESELFGHMKGSFTGAVALKLGLFEAAHRGTLFLDEVGELPFTMQVKLLRVIQERKFLRIGAIEDVEVDVRLIAATNKKLADEVQAGRFREDLFYRLNVIQIELPPLRLRRGDIPLLAEHFLKKYSRETHKNIQRLSPETLERLVQYDYPGNVRELENIIERSVALESGSTIQELSLPSQVLYPQKDKSMTVQEADFHLSQEGLELDPVLATFEKDILVRALEKTQGSRVKAAKLLGISNRSLRYRLKKHGIGREDEEEIETEVDEVSDKIQNEGE